MVLVPEVAVIVVCVVDVVPVSDCLMAASLTVLVGVVGMGNMVREGALVVVAFMRAVHVAVVEVVGMVAVENGDVSTSVCVDVGVSMASPFGSQLMRGPGGQTVIAPIAERGRGGKRSPQPCDASTAFGARPAVVCAGMKHRASPRRSHVCTRVCARAVNTRRAARTTK